MLEELAAEIALVAPDVVYRSYLIEGNGVGTIDIGFMVRDTISVDEVIQLGKDEYFMNPITGADEILHDRPPLLLYGRHLDQTQVYVLGVHMRSLGGIYGGEGLRVRQKRYEQANSVAEKVQTGQDLDPEAPIVILGDFNAFEFSDSYVDVVGQIRGDFTPTENVVCETNAPGGQILGGPVDMTRPHVGFDTEDTAGCSCEQIIDYMGLGQGHMKFGCSTGAMRTWVKKVHR